MRVKYAFEVSDERESKVDVPVYLCSDFDKDKNILIKKYKVMRTALKNGSKVDIVSLTNSFVNDLECFGVEK